MRIVRFTVPGATASDQASPQYGALTGDLDEFGQPADDAVIVALAGDPLYAGIHILEQTYPLSAVGLLAPVIPRSKIVAIGKNYADHAAEMGGEVPTEPLMFLKPNTSVIGPGDGIVYPTQSQNVHYEGELAIVISRICRDVPPERAAEVIYGFTLANDVTARDLQAKDGQFTRAKGFDTFCPLGPWIETELSLDTIKEGIAIQTYLDGDLVQDGSTKDLMFDIPAIIEAVTSVMTLLPGDVILTGTPSGVGPMTVGQEVEIASPALGALMNTVVRKS